MIIKKNKFVLMVTLLMFAFLIPAFQWQLEAGCGTTWKNGNVTKEVTFRDVVYANGFFLAVGDGGTVYKSSNGSSWSKVSTGFSSADHIFGVAYGNGYFVGAMRDKRIVRADSSGKNWSVKYNGGGTEDLYAAAYGNGTFVVLGETGSAYTSLNNGGSWSKVSTSYYFRTLKFGAGIFVAGTGGGQPRILTSTDGRNWTVRHTPPSNIRGIAFSGTKWIAGGGKDVYLCQEPDAKTWSRSLRGEKFNLVDQFYSAYASDALSLYIAAGEHGLLFTSPDGINWTKRTSGTQRFLLGMDYGNGVITAVGNGGPRDPNSVYLYSTHYSECGGGTGPGSITITSPNGSEQWEVGSLNNIEWTSSGSVGDVTIDYSTDNGATWIPLDGHALNDGDRPWVLPDTVSNSCLVRIYEYGTGESSDISDSVFSIISPNRVTLTTPNGGEIWQGGTTQNISWSSEGTVGNLKIEYSFDNGADYSTIVTSTSNDGGYPWDLPTTVDSVDCIIRLSEVDGQANDVSDEVFTITSPPTISLDKAEFNFAYAEGGSVPGAQTLGIINTGGGSLTWDIVSDADWAISTPASGTGNAYVDISIDPTALVMGTYTGTLTVSDPNSTNKSLTFIVNLTVKGSSEDEAPFGDFSTPSENVTVNGSVPITGWALDDIELISVKIYYNESSYIGDAVFVEGARTDIESAYPSYPQSSRAGWGYMMLTNALPDDNYKLYAVAEDNAGNKVTLGESNVIIDNASAVKPFGAIDAPSQGGNAFGSRYVNWGWALTPMPNKIPTDGSTITIWVDGTPLGNPYEYNVTNANVAALFPDYENSDGPTGYLHIDTTGYADGVHTISWTVTDNAGNSEGIGSRYFNIRNVGSSSTSSAQVFGQETDNLKRRLNPSRGAFLEVANIANLPVSATSLQVRQGYDIQQPAPLFDDGEAGVTIKEDQRIELLLNNGSPFPGCIGYMVVGDKLRPLPIGSSLDSDKGIFYWQPGPGFLGDYHFVFITKEKNGELKKVVFLLRITPKFSN